MTVNTVGVVGGGQLGRMLGEAAAPLGIDLVVSDPTPAAPAAQVAEQLVGGFDDPEVVRGLAERADVLTYEIELADPDVLARVGEETGTPVHPAPETLRMIQDKLAQKRRLADAGVPVPAFRAVESAADLRGAIEEFGVPVMLKAREGGYDGRGTVRVDDRAEAPSAMEKIEGPAMVEEFVPFDCELAVMGCRADGETDTFPVTETIHEAAILRETVSPPRAPQSVREQARAVARDVLAVMEGRGVFGIELFASEGEILLNEIAPRPHNSGHWTIEGCHTSQFEQHLRAVTGLPLGTTERRCPTASSNLLGTVEQPRPATLEGLSDALATDRLAVHWYDKDEVRPLRKMGHVTLPGVEASPDELVDAVRDARAQFDA